MVWPSDMDWCGYYAALAVLRPRGQTNLQKLRACGAFLPWPGAQVSSAIAGIDYARSRQKSLKRFGAKAV